MRIKVIVLVFFLILQTAVSQTKKVDNVDLPNFNDMGSVYNDSLVNHYLFYKRFTDDKKSEGVLKFYDGNLSEVKEEVFPLDKDYAFLEAKNCGDLVIVGFHNFKNESNLYTIYSNDGKLIYSKEISFKKNSFNPYGYKIAEKIGEYTMIFPVKNKGFLITTVEKKKRFGYSIHFLGSDSAKGWIYESPKEHNNRKSVVPLFANEKVVVLMEKEWGSVYDRQPTFIPIIIDVNTGKELFRLSHRYEEIPNFYTKAYVNDKEEVILFGEKYKLDNNFPDDDYNIGYFIEKYSVNGTLLSSNTFAFDDVNFKTALKYNANDKQKDFGTIFFQDIMDVGGHLWLVGEKSKRDKQGFTIAKALITGSILGVSTIANQNWNTEFSNGDLVLLELDENLKLINTFDISKVKNKVGLNTMIVRPYFNLMELNYDHFMNYVNASKRLDGLLNLVYLDRIEHDKKTDFVLYTSLLEKGKSIATEQLKLDLSSNDFYFRVIPTTNKNILFSKFNAENRFIQLELLKFK